MTDYIKYDYIRCYIMNAYHNIEDGDADYSFVYEQLAKAMKLIETIKTNKFAELVDA